MVTPHHNLLIGILDMVDLDNLFLVSHSLIYFLVDSFQHPISLRNLRKELTEPLLVVAAVALVLLVDLVEPIVVKVVLVVEEQVVVNKILQNQIIHPLLETLKALVMLIPVPKLQWWWWRRCAEFRYFILWRKWWFGYCYD